MGRRATVDREELFDAANRLVLEGKEVSATELREMLGGGSFNTIYKFLNEWRAGQPSEPPPSPDQIPALVQTAFLNTWRVATQEADRLLDEAKEKAAEEVREAQKQFADALKSIEKLEADSEADAREIESLKGRTGELEAELKDAQGKVAGLAATVEQVKQQLEKVEKEKASDRKERDDAMKQAAELRGQLEAIKAQNAELLSRLDKKQEKKS